MAPSYYVIELTARWLAVLLAALAGVMILAFVFGYGAAWSVLEHGSHPPEAAVAAPVRGTPTPTPVEVRIEGGGPSPTVEAPAAPAPTDTATPRPPATAMPPPPATPTPRPSPSSEEKVEGFWVQVLASSNADAVKRSQGKLEDLGFTRARQLVLTTRESDGNELHKLRVGPFPDRDSAERVAKRMQASGFSGAWVVAP
jgi:cell division septation protein DedD